LQFAAVGASVAVNVLLAMALNVALTERPSAYVSHAELPSVTVVAKRMPPAASRLAAASTDKSF
jgi:hypothetical protein